jgi:plasmid stabilization system protein ParE
MIFEVLMTQSAEQDLKELKHYLQKNFGLHTWQESYKQIKQAIHQLQAYPLIGRVPEEIEQISAGQFRQVITGMNRLIYEIREQKIYIHLVCDTRRDLQSVLSHRLLRIN